MRQLLLALGVPAVLALAQQQWLLRQPPRLEALEPAPASSGPAALRSRFSRPMDSASIARSSRLQPPLEHRWLGEGDGLMLSLSAGQRLSEPLRLELEGRDRRGLALRPGAWWWDPRPRVLAVVPVPGGEQLQLRERDGRWHPLSPVWHRILQVQPTGGGRSLALVSRSPEGEHRVWRLPLRQRNLAPLAQGLGPVQAGRLEPLLPESLTFAHLSGNQRGDLLVQSTMGMPGESVLRLWSAGGDSRLLDLEASGGVQLLPEGGAAVVPLPEGLALVDLPPRVARRQILPGSRDLSSFCPQAGRALLVRHWPDFRRSLELVEPGQAPRHLWVGSQALMASACDRGGQRVWVLLLDATGAQRLTLLSLDRQGRLLRRRTLTGWELEPGTGLQYDPSTDRLLATLRPVAAAGSTTGPKQTVTAARAVLIDATRLELDPLDQPVLQAQWLPAG
ncbi:hypothetical protein [Synechococcus sp. CBW1006]|uniref:hypothetical protein n=1 Tax=Synechococcus sp. CBW1006 TaxID=1353138 RepID=UPI0018CF9CFA|nr:hypothetical protein [Synechococcus sp. CBW1006]QPN66602.1 hypothetical protein H8F26_18095 [Synechococcus sp. CBW1006]